MKIKYFFLGLAFFCLNAKVFSQSITLTPNNSEMIKLDRNGDSYQKFFHNNIYKSYMGIVGANDFYLQTTLDNNLGKIQIGTKNISRFVIHPSGKIGAGILDYEPISNFQVAGGTEDLTKSGGDFSVGSSTGHLKFGVATTGANAGEARIYAEGVNAKTILGAESKDIMSVSYQGVGIGTLNPSEFFHLSGGSMLVSNTSSKIYLKNTVSSGNSELRFLNSSNASKGYFLYDQPTNKLNMGHYETSQTTGLYIDNLNRFGFGQATPTAKVHLKHIAYNATPTLLLEENTVNEGAVMEFKNNNASTWQIVGKPGSTDINSSLKINYSSGTSGEILSLYGNGKMIMKQGTTDKIEFYANNTFNGSRITMNDVDGNRSIEMYSTDGSSSKPGRITFRNPVDDSIIMDLDADFSNTGRSRIVVDELQITGGADIAEYFNVNKKVSVEAGTVVSLDLEDQGALLVSNKSNDPNAIGVVSGANGVSAGIMVRQKGNGVVDGEYPIAIAGRVYVKAEAFKKSIKLGDLLTSSNLEGHAMKAGKRSRAKGTVIGKALSELPTGSGLVLVLLGNR